MDSCRGAWMITCLLPGSDEGGSATVERCMRPALSGVSKGIVDSKHRKPGMSPRTGESSTGAD